MKYVENIRIYDATREKADRKGGIHRHIQHPIQGMR